MGLAADVVAVVDDDNIPLPGWGQDLLVGREVEVNFYETELPAFDPVGATTTFADGRLDGTKTCVPAGMAAAHALVASVDPLPGRARPIGPTCNAGSKAAPVKARDDPGAGCGRRPSRNTARSPPAFGTSDDKGGDRSCLTA